VKLVKPGSLFLSLVLAREEAAKPQKQMEKGRDIETQRETDRPTEGGGWG
jgi:hypothetical protein